MFPPINVQTIKLADCRRVVLFHYLKEDQTVEVRHYSIRAVPTGISRSVAGVVQVAAEPEPPEGRQRVPHQRRRRRRGLDRGGGRGEQGGAGPAVRGPRERAEPAE
ncbi:unnamed protein product, partial [Heterosigma akashiwo]